VSVTNSESELTPAEPPSPPGAGPTSEEPITGAPPGWKREVIAGLTTFLTMSYIVVLNPQILSATGLPQEGLVTATVLAAAVGSILMGLFARLPYALAPGMGINAFFTYELVLQRNVPPKVALGLVVWSGVIFLVLSLTPLRRQLASTIPLHLRGAIAGGIGLFLAFIGLKNAGLIVPHPVTFVTLGPLDTRHLLFLAGLGVAFGLHIRGKPYAFLAGIAVATLPAFALSAPPKLAPHEWVQIPDSLWSAPDGSLLFSADLRGALDVALLAPLVTLLFTDLFDSLSTFLGVAQASGLVDEEGEPIRLERALAVDATATLTSGLFGTSPATTYVESTAGIEAGGRTGLTAVVAGLAFLPLIFFSPLLAVIPPYATAPVLLIVGALMIRAADLRDRPLEETLPAFAVLLLIPLSFSITTGLLVGFLLHTLCFCLARRWSELPPMMWALFLISLGLLGFEHWA